MVVICVVMFIVGVIATVVGVRQFNQGDCWFVVGTVVLIFAIVLLFTTAFMYVDSMCELANLETFYNVNKANYTTTIQETKDAVLALEGNSTVSIPVENLQQSTNWSNRISEYRDAIVDYNLKLMRLRRLNSNPILDSMYANPPEGLKYIEMVKGE